MGKLLNYCKGPVLLLLLIAVGWPARTVAQTIRPSAQREVKIYDPNTSGSGAVGLRAAGSTSSYALTFPATPPSTNNVLGIDAISGGVATMTWTTAVNSFSGGTTGLTPNSTSTGAITLGGTLNVSNGGTGATTLSGILLGNGTGAFTAITNSSGVAGAISDETGSGALVFGTSPTVSSLTVSSGGATITAGGLTITSGGITVNEGGASVIGNVSINNNGTAGELRLLEPTGSGTNYTALRAQAQNSNVTYLLPPSDGNSGQVLSTNGSGTLSWNTVTTTVPLSTLVAATSSNTINNDGFEQVWQWNTLAGGSGLSLSTNSTAAVSNTQTLLSLSMSGANGTASQTTYGAQISNSHTGSNSTNVGLQLSASGATNNYGLLITNGSVGIGIATPTSALHVVGDATFTGNVTGAAFFESSDRRLKNLISRDGDVAYFVWKDGRDTKTHIGYIAQEIQTILPDQVKADEKGFLSVNYTEVLVLKIRELEKRVEELKRKKLASKARK